MSLVYLMTMPTKRLKETVSKKFFIYKFKNKQKKGEFRFDPKEHSLKVSANSVEGSG